MKMNQFALKAWFVAFPQPYKSASVNSKETMYTCTWWLSYI